MSNSKFIIYIDGSGNYKIDVSTNSKQYLASYDSYTPNQDISIMRNVAKQSNLTSVSDSKTFIYNNTPYIPPSPRYDISIQNKIISSVSHIITDLSYSNELLGKLKLTINPIALDTTTIFTSSENLNNFINTISDLSHGQASNISNNELFSASMVRKTIDIPDSDRSIDISCVSGDISTRKQKILNDSSSININRYHTEDLKLTLDVSSITYKSISFLAGFVSKITSLTYEWPTVTAPTLSNQQYETDRGLENILTIQNTSSVPGDILLFRKYGASEPKLDISIASDYGDIWKLDDNNNTSSIYSQGIAFKKIGANASVDISIPKYQFNIDSIDSSTQKMYSVIWHNTNYSDELDDLNDRGFWGKLSTFDVSVEYIHPPHLCFYNNTLKSVQGTTDTPRFLGTIGGGDDYYIQIQYDKKLTNDSSASTYIFVQPSDKISLPDLYKGNQDSSNYGYLEEVSNNILYMDDIPNHLNIQSDKWTDISFVTMEDNQIVKRTTKHNTRIQIKYYPWSNLKVSFANKYKIDTSYIFSDIRTYIIQMDSSFHNEKYISSVSDLNNTEYITLPSNLPYYDISDISDISNPTIEFRPKVTNSFISISDSSGYDIGINLFAKRNIHSPNNTSYNSSYNRLSLSTDLKPVLQTASEYDAFIGLTSTNTNILKHHQHYIGGTILEKNGNYIDKVSDLSNDMDIYFESPVISGGRALFNTNRADSYMVMNDFDISVDSSIIKVRVPPLRHTTTNNTTHLEYDLLNDISELNNTSIDNSISITHSNIEKIKTIMPNITDNISILYNQHVYNESDPYNNKYTIIKDMSTYINGIDEVENNLDLITDISNDIHNIRNISNFAQLINDISLYSGHITKLIYATSSMLTKYNNIINNISPLQDYGDTATSLIYKSNKFAFFSVMGGAGRPQSNYEGVINNSPSYLYYSKIGYPSIRNAKTMMDWMLKYWLVCDNYAGTTTSNGIVPFRGFNIRIKDSSANITDPYQYVNKLLATDLIDDNDISTYISDTSIIQLYDSSSFKVDGDDGDGNIMGFSDSSGNTYTEWTFIYRNRDTKKASYTSYNNGRPNAITFFAVSDNQIVKPLAHLSFGSTSTTTPTVDRTFESNLDMANEVGIELSSNGVTHWPYNRGFMPSGLSDGTLGSTFFESIYTPAPRSHIGHKSILYLKPIYYPMQRISESIWYHTNVSKDIINTVCEGLSDIKTHLNDTSNSSNNLHNQISSMRKNGTSDSTSIQCHCSIQSDCSALLIQKSGIEKIHIAFDSSQLDISKNVNTVVILDKLIIDSSYNYPVYSTPSKYLKNKWSFVNTHMKAPVILDSSNGNTTTHLSYNSDLSGKIIRYHDMYHIQDNSNNKYLSISENGDNNIYLTDLSVDAARFFCIPDDVSIQRTISDEWGRIGGTEIFSESNGYDISDYPTQLYQDNGTRFVINALLEYKTPTNLFYERQTAVKHDTSGDLYIFDISLSTDVSRYMAGIYVNKNKIVYKKENRIYNAEKLANTISEWNNANVADISLDIYNIDISLATSDISIDITTSLDISIPNYSATFIINDTSYTDISGFYIDSSVYSKDYSFTDNNGTYNSLDRSGYKQYIFVKYIEPHVHMSRTWVESLVEPIYPIFGNGEGLNDYRYYPNPPIYTSFFTLTVSDVSYNDISYSNNILQTTGPGINISVSSPPTPGTSIYIQYYDDISYYLSVSERNMIKWTSVSSDKTIFTCSKTGSNPDTFQLNANNTNTYLSVDSSNELCAIDKYVRDTFKWRDVSRGEQTILEDRGTKVTGITSIKGDISMSYLSGQRDRYTWDFTIPSIKSQDITIGLIEEQDINMNVRHAGYYNITVGAGDTKKTFKDAASVFENDERSWKFLENINYDIYPNRRHSGSKGPGNVDVSTGGFLLSAIPEDNVSITISIITTPSYDFQREETPYYRFYIIGGTPGSNSVDRKVQFSWVPSWGTYWDQTRIYNRFICKKNPNSEKEFYLQSYNGLPVYNDNGEFTGDISDTYLSVTDEGYLSLSTSGTSFLFEPIVSENDISGIFLHLNKGILHNKYTDVSVKIHNTLDQEFNPDSDISRNDLIKVSVDLNFDLSTVSLDISINDTHWTATVSDIPSDKTFYTWGNISKPEVPLDFKLHNSASSRLTISDDYRKITCTSTSPRNEANSDYLWNGGTAILGNTVTTGIHIWEIIIDTSLTGSVMFGICSADHTDEDVLHYTSYATYIDLYKGDVYSRSDPIFYKNGFSSNNPFYNGIVYSSGEMFKSGDRVGIYHNAHSGEIQYLKNGNLIPNPYLENYLTTEYLKNGTPIQFFVEIAKKDDSVSVSANALGSTTDSITLGNLKINPGGPNLLSHSENFSFSQIPKYNDITINQENINSWWYDNSTIPDDNSTIPDDVSYDISNLTIIPGGTTEQRIGTRHLVDNNKYLFKINPLRLVCLYYSSELNYKYSKLLDIPVISSVSEGPYLNTILYESGTYNSVYTDDISITAISYVSSPVNDNMFEYPGTGNGGYMNKAIELFNHKYKSESDSHVDIWQDIKTELTSPIIYWQIILAPTINLKQDISSFYDASSDYVNFRNI